MMLNACAMQDLALAPASEDDFESLLSLRLAAMRESLQRVGRFDPQRARERLSRAFEPAHSRHILLAGESVGFVVISVFLRTYIRFYTEPVPQFQTQSIS